MPVYVYGAVRAAHPVDGLTGVEGAAVRVVEAGRVAALASDLDAEPVPGRRQVAAHGDVLHRAMRGGPVVPYRFGHLVEADADVVGHLRTDERRLRALLDDLDGKVELMVTLRHEQERLLREVLSADTGLRRLNEATRRRPDLPARMELGSRLAEAVEQQRRRDADAVVRALGRRVAAAAVDRLDDERLRVAVLVGTAAADDVAEVSQEAVGARAEVDVVGPLPPYHFVGG